jgi:hypothetical protein
LPGSAAFDDGRTYILAGHTTRLLSLLIWVSPARTPLSSTPNSPLDRCAPIHCFWALSSPPPVSSKRGYTRTAVASFLALLGSLGC